MKCVVNELTAKEICEIISACGNAGVTEFNLDKLTIKCGKAPEAVTTTCYWPPQEEVRPDLEGQVESEALEDEGEEVRERQISETIVTDPLAYEELVLNGDINAETEYITTEQ